MSLAGRSWDSARHGNMRRFDSLQCFRGLAALAVVSQHASLSTNAFVGTIPQWADVVFTQGFLGVDFFFVLSGFIILSSHLDDDRNVLSLKAYLSRRFLRIFPPYWPVSLAMVVLYVAFPGMSAGTRSGFSLLSSLFLVPDALPPALAAAWTLMHEILFYSIFCLFYISLYLFFTTIFIWGIAIIVSLPPLGLTLSPLHGYLLAPINLEFLMGMSVALLARTLSRQRLGQALVPISILSFCGLLLWVPPETHRVLYGVPFATLVLGFVCLEQQVGIRTPRWLVHLGDASYSIYLTHDPAISAAIRLLVRLPLLATWWTAMFANVATGVAFGICYHRVVEKPLIEIFRRLMLRPRGRVAARNSRTTSRCG